MKAATNTAAVKQTSYSPSILLRSGVKILLTTQKVIVLLRITNISHLEPSSSCFQNSVKLYSLQALPVPNVNGEFTSSKILLIVTTTLNNTVYETKGAFTSGPFWFVPK